LWSKEVGANESFGFEENTANDLNNVEKVRKSFSKKESPEENARGLSREPSNFTLWDHI